MTPAPDPLSSTTRQPVRCAAMNGDETDIDALLRKQDWGKMYARLLAFAKGRLKSKADAEDLVQDTIRRVLDPNWERWDPEKHPDLFEFMTGILNRLRSNNLTSARTHRELVMDMEAKEGSRERGRAKKAGKVAASAPTPEEQLARAEVVGPRIERVRAEAAGDEVAEALLEEIEDGNDVRREIARATGYSAAQIKAGKQRLSRIVKRVVRETSEEEPK
jgi:DNA-directed RNA polymerase specialized sigma24 family protein